MTVKVIPRRKALHGLGAVVASAKLSALIGCGNDTTGHGPSPQATSSGGTSGGAAPAPSSTSALPPTSRDAGTCELYPAQTEGPYYFDAELVRKDITEGKLG